MGEKMSLRVLMAVVCFLAGAFHLKTIESVKSNIQAHEAKLNARDTASSIGASYRQLVGFRRINPIRAILSRPRVSPLYLINGTVCRLINFQPVCTTLSTTGLAVGGGSASGGGGGGGSGGASRPSSGASSGGSGSSGGGGSGGGGGSSGARPSSAGVLSGGSSVQFANPPSRTSAVLQADQSGSYVERADSTGDGGPPNSGQQSSGFQSASSQPQGVMVARRPLRLLPFRRATQAPQMSAQAREYDTEKVIKDVKKVVANRVRR